MVCMISPVAEARIEADPPGGGGIFRRGSRRLAALPVEFSDRSKILQSVTPVESE